jgi:hypothetical protein
MAADAMTCPDCGERQHPARVASWSEAARAWFFVSGVCAGCQDPHCGHGPRRSECAVCTGIGYQAGAR